MQVTYVFELEAHSVVALLLGRRRHHLSFTQPNLLPAIGKVVRGAFATLLRLYSHRVGVRVDLSTKSGIFGWKLLTHGCQFELKSATH